MRWLPLAASLLLPGIGAAAPTFVVDSILDAPGGGSLGDGVCETATGNGVCTLRAAVMEANAVPGGGATIRLPAGTYHLSRPHAELGGAEEGDLDLDAPLTIVGAGPGATIVDGNDLDRVFAIRGKPVFLRALTITNGRAPSGESGGGIAVFSGGGSTLDDVAVTANESAWGGGIYSDGELTLRHCIVEVNTGESGGGGVFATWKTQIEDSSIRGNTAEEATGWGGGGILAWDELRVERTLIAENRGWFGGGIALHGEFPDAIVLNSTLDRNTSGAGAGAGLYAGGGTTLLLHATVTDNLNPFGGGGGLYVDPGASLLLRNSVVAGNEGLGSGGAREPSECGPPGTPVLSGDYNLIGNRASCVLTGSLSHVNASDVDPQLLPLAPNGGFAPDRAGSGPTIAAIPAASCTDELGVPLREDQRGYARTGACDVGAHQVGGRYAPEALLGVELLRNGGADGNELGTTDGIEIVPPPYWAAPGSPLTQIRYGLPGGFPLASQAPANSGSLLFEGGQAESARGVQGIDLSALAAEIDAGEVRFRVSGAFGGYSGQDDRAALALLFTNDDDVFESVSIGGFTAADRNGETRLLPDSASGVVPAGVRFVDVTLEMTRADGVRNDGYADDLSLVLPEPAADLLGSLAVIALCALRGRAGR